MDLKEITQTIHEWKNENRERHVLFMGIDVSRGEKAAVVAGDTTDIMAMIIIAMTQDPSIREIIEKAVKVANSESFKNYCEQINPNLN